MGVNQSRPHPTSSSSSSSTHGAASTTPTRLEPRRRESIQALPSGKATAAPPSESRESATAHHSTAQLSQPLPSRQRSRTIESAPPTPHSTEAKMGNEQSRQGHEDPESGMKPFHPTRPVDVPTAGDSSARDETSTIKPAAPPHDQYHILPSQTHRPPRLPLPIEEEDHTPGSPIISSADLASALDHDDVEGALPRRSSVLSGTTVDEDEVGDELHADAVDGERRKTIPTVIEWLHGGEKVYVTGTFASWNRKFRLHKDPSGNRLSAIVPLPPGTHHLKFIVDGEMRTSDDMPTAVDYTNILVNYLEVSATNVPATQAPGSKLVDARHGKAQHSQEGVTGVHQAQLQADAQTHGPGLDTHAAKAEPTVPTAKTGEPTKLAARPKRWTSKIPQYLEDLDQPEDSQAYQRASAAIAELPPPPSLPLFLNKSILNGSTPMKDDSSVLSMPNHTVLNHLATSSIRSGVLATSATTRYKKKHVTTVLYKPTNEEDE